MAFALAVRNTVTKVRQLFFTTTCVITITTVIFIGGCAMPAMSFLEVSQSASVSDYRAGEQAWSLASGCQLFFSHDRYYAVAKRLALRFLSAFTMKNSSTALRRVQPPRPKVGTAATLAATAIHSSGHAADRPSLRLDGRASRARGSLSTRRESTKCCAIAENP